MKTLSTFAALMLAAASLLPAQDLSGDWMGSVVVFPLKTHLVFHLTAAGGNLAATIDNLEQETNGSAGTVTRNGAALKIQVAEPAGVFEGQVNPEFTSIEGAWTQAGKSQRLVLNRLRRPQNPVKPYPYAEEEVAYENRAAGIRLAATLTIPRGAGPFPAVVLIPASGPKDRDESISAHRPFLVLADYLTRRGIAVLRADDRGLGKSGGKFAGASMADFAADAEAGMAYLKTRKQIDARRIGLLGHSEGGTLASMVAARNPGVRFLVLMAGTGVPGEEVMVMQVRLLNAGTGPTLLVAERERQILDIVRQEKSPAAVTQKLQQAMPGRTYTPPEIQELTAPWFVDFLDYDPATALRKVKCPVLALNGEKDRQVFAKQNLPAIRKALEDGGNQNFEIAELPGLNHLFQTTAIGFPAEYPDLEETIAPAALEKIARWIASQAGK